MTLTLTLLDEIERGLQGVTPGPWLASPEAGFSLGLSQILLPREELRVAIASFVRDADAAHIARMDPATVAELVRLARIGMEAQETEKKRRVEPTCKTCRFFRAPDDRLKVPGFCQRRAPAVVPDSQFKFPVASPDGWCGEHEAVET